MKTLDRTRDYGQIIGGGEMAFEQDGCFFNVHGEQVGEGPAEAPKNKGGRPPKQVNSELEAQIEANLRG